MTANQKATFTVTLPAGVRFEESDSALLEYFQEFLAQQSFEKRDAMGDDEEVTSEEWREIEESATAGTR